MADMDQLKVQVQPHKINGCRFGSAEGSGSTTQNGSVNKRAIFNLIADMDQLKVQVQPHKMDQ
jgi:hypothetical protein